MSCFLILLWESSFFSSPRNISRCLEKNRRFKFQILRWVMLVLQPKSNPPMTRWGFCKKEKNDGFTGFLRKLSSTHSSLTLNMTYANSKLSARGKKWVKYLIGYCDEYELFYEPLITRAHNLCHDNRQLIVIAINRNHSASKINCN